MQAVYLKEAFHGKKDGEVVKEFGHTLRKQGNIVQAKRGDEWVKYGDLSKASPTATVATRRIDLQHKKDAEAIERRWAQPPSEFFPKGHHAEVLKMAQAERGKEFDYYHFKFKKEGSKLKWWDKKTSKWQIWEK